jgi:hypothetical protein
MNAYTDDRILRNQEDQKRLDSATGSLFANVSTSTSLWNPQDLEVMLFVKALNVLHRDRPPLRLVQTVCTGSPRPHARIIHGPPTDPIWQCYTKGESITSEGELGVDHGSYLLNLGLMRRAETELKLIFRSKQPHSVWAEPLLKADNEVVGVIAVQIYSHFTTENIFPFQPDLALGASAVARILESS